MAILHVVDPATEAPGDKLRKVESLIDYFKSRCLSLYQPRQNLAIDERLVKSRHRSGIRQYIRDKPTKYGIKLWVLADSSNGYTIDFNVYIGKAAGRDVSENGLGYDVVMTLIKPFLNQGYRLFVDIIFTLLSPCSKICLPRGSLLQVQSWTPDGIFLLVSRIVKTGRRERTGEICVGSVIPPV